MRVLIVEDDPALSSVWVDALEDAGHAVRTAHSNGEAMKALLTDRFDLITLDVLVGDSNALSLTHYISYAQPDVPILVITGSGFFPNGEVASIAPTIDWLLRKPLPVSDFMAMIDHVERRLHSRRRGQGDPCIPQFVSP